MFSGIVQATGSVTALSMSGSTLQLELSVLESITRDLEVGASVAVQGVCLTVTSVTPSSLTFDAVAETLDRSTIGSLEAGHKVNLERSLRFGSEVGGHVTSGHVDTVASIVEIVDRSGSIEMTFRLPAPFMKYILPKGYIALDGASLTIAAVYPDRSDFKVALIPETLRVTTFGQKAIGDRLNVEIDRQTQAIVDTVERVLALR